MSDRDSKTFVRVLAVAALLTAGVAASDHASAQEPIMLETIGAVRMAQPEELRRMAAEQQSAGLQAQGETRRREQDAAAR